MPDTPSNYTASAVLWLESILHERFGLPLCLSLITNQWQLRMTGTEGIVLMDAMPDTFTRADSGLPFCLWDGQAEGWPPVLGKPLPAPGVAATIQPLVEEVMSGYHIHYDLLGLAYWMLTRQEEVGRTDLDQHGRFPATASHAFKYDYLERPVVDEWLHLLGQIIQRAWPGCKLKQHRFSIKVSHDVDAPSRHGFRSWRRLVLGAGSDLLRNRDPRGLLAPWIRMTTRRRLHPLDSFNTFDWIMDQSEGNGLTSAFYFICGQQGTPFNADYDVGHPAIRELIRRIHRRGHEIGLHPSYGSFLDPDRIAEEAARLRQVCGEEGVTQKEFGGRMHYLQWRQTTTLRAWDSAGMAYDSTLGYADHVGFRCGTCYEFPAFELTEQKALTLRVRPLIVMEGTVLGKRYMGLGLTRGGLERILKIRKTCEIISGTFVLLWHNSVLRNIHQQSMYKDLF